MIQVDGATARIAVMQAAMQSRYNLETSAMAALPFIVVYMLIALADLTAEFNDYKAAHP